jgi:ribosomal-protein-alanine N-acetyltransferase
MIGLQLLVLADADLDALSQLHGSCFDDRWSASFLRSLLSTPGSFAAVAGAKSVPDGFIIGRLAADEVEILTLAVRPGSRRCGLGSALVGFAAAHAAALGARAVFLEVGTSNSSARALYAAQGFSPVGARGGYYALSNGSPEDAIILSASLPLDPLGKSQGVG